MAKAERLKKNREFRRTFDQGRSVANRLVVLYVSRRDDGLSRVGYSVSRRHGSAVVRNRLKRRLREGFLRVEECVPPGHSLVWIPRGPALEAPFTALCDAMASLLRRSGVCSEEEG